jgi:hypothetical protein
VERTGRKRSVISSRVRAGPPFTTTLDSTTANMADPRAEREIVTANEAFLIGVLQAVSGGSMVAGFSQAEQVSKSIGKLPFLIFLTLVSSALLAAVLSAYWRHEYKKWNLKAGVSRARGVQEEFVQRIGWANRDLAHMRGAFLVSLFLIVAGYGVLVVSMWYQWAAN